jgi:hypothetical protein
MLSSNKTLNAFLVGLLSIVVGVGYLFILPRLASGAKARIRAQEPMSAAALAASPPGGPVLLEGLVGAENETHYRTMVAYRRTVPMDGPDGRVYQLEQDRVAPPLRIDLPGGSVTVQGGYRIEEPSRTWVTKQYNYGGFDRGDTVLVVGEQAPDGSIRAELIAGGTRSDYLFERSLERWGFYVGGLCAVVLGALVAAGALLVWRARLRAAR